MITTRNAIRADIYALYEILNEIVNIGGTTSFEPPFTLSDFERYFFTKASLSLVVAENQAEILGWQALDRHPQLPSNIGDIASYVKPSFVGKGIGKALFEHSLMNARARGLTAINATIRADNISGLHYYSKMGFIDHSADPSFALKAGQIVGQITKRFSIT